MKEKKRSNLKDRWWTTFFLEILHNIYDFFISFSFQDSKCEGMKWMRPNVKFSTYELTTSERNTLIRNWKVISKYVWSWNFYFWKMVIVEAGHWNGYNPPGTVKRTSPTVLTRINVSHKNSARIKTNMHCQKKIGSGNFLSFIYL